VNFIQFFGPNHALQVFGIRLVGVNAETGKKLLLTLILIVLSVLLSWALRKLTRLLSPGNQRAGFWVRQAVHILVAALVIVGVTSIWFDDPGRLATALGLVTAGIAFALQRVITAMAGYILIMRGKTFNVGDRIVMGGVRGDVIGLGFMQTTIMEMGQPPPVQNADPAMWVKARQYTGRIVAVSNAKVFDEPVFNYTRDFPYIWEEMTIPISYKDDRAAADRILLDAAQRNTLKINELSEPAIRELERRFAMKRQEMVPKVYWRMTDNWLEMTVRFLAEDHGVRDLKDRMTRELLQELDAAHIGIASATVEIVGLPPLRINRVESKMHLQTAGDNGAS
jgi:small-conductance mechanosensitive channel